MKCQQRWEAQADDIDFLSKKAKQRKTYFFLEVPVSVCLQGNAEGGGAFFVCNILFIDFTRSTIQHGIHKFI